MSDLSLKYQAALSALVDFADAASVNETEWTGWGEQAVPPGATMMRVKADQAMRALRDAYPNAPTVSKSDANLKATNLAGMTLAISMLISVLCGAAFLLADDQQIASACRPRQMATGSTWWFDHHGNDCTFPIPVNDTKPYCAPELC